MVLICLFLLPLALCLSLLLNRWMIRLGQRFGQFDRPQAQSHKQHRRPVPNLGGVAIFLSVFVPAAACLGGAWIVPPSSWGGWLSPVGPHVAGIRAETPVAVAMLVGLAVVHVLGLVDDRRPISALPKLVVQLAVAGLLAAGFQVRIAAFLAAFGPAGWFVSVLISVLWMVAITNAINMLDNMDGLAAGVGAMIALVYLADTLEGGQWFVAALCALLAGALLGFLFYNIAPARLFMGDGGSLVVGLLLAVISVRTTYMVMPQAEAPSMWYAALMPLVVMAVPLYDLASVTLIRLCRGRSPFAADRSHLSHRLVGLGLTPRAAVGVIWLVSLATGLGGVLLASVRGWQALLVALQTAAVLAVLATLEVQVTRRDPLDAQVRQN